MTTAIELLKFVSKRALIGRKRPSTFEEYLDWQPNDGYYYEWARGKLLTIDPLIYPKYAHIAHNLTRLFNATGAYQEGGSLLPAVRMTTTAKQARVPDMSYWTLRQQRLLAVKSPTVSDFIIELISQNDVAHEVENKLEEYFHSGVKMVWHIFPHIQKIYVYTSPDHNHICRGDAICSAETVVKGFSIKVKDIFKLP